ncbi:NAD(P)-dependent dehydrogenase (short-subunit alcohol dehydrogenase family) [Chryseobacterium rhizosphaerae]|uniref:NAD(P)-dependent dehydrogenase (Short-subunit alcohol dehydrogenase family) n=1 Tax=Chryseobacterium rhizosphaerae TaxID=395937 RepID=A0AAE4C3Q4_9FLAO|nr:SDR family NAD(P)-dependent oxidoreductase [Chryseobacterium rhizosphaerae]MDR6528811.1 NAD(P)-dependent dehydrogenase (short-subunit alcohol dehydrogenase family) [Chryseobacterium rhizosphaerae]
MKRFENKVAFITGGNSGIGKAVAVLMAREGAKVMIADIQENKETLEEVLKEGTDARFITCDVSNPEDVEKAVAETIEVFGNLDIGVNNAGIVDASPIHEKSIEEWQRVININLSGVFYGMKYQIAQMRKQETGGAIVNMGSIMSQVAEFGIGSYASSKHGLVGLTKVAALENGTNNIRVNAIGPGYIETPLLMDNAAQNVEYRSYMESKHAMKRLGKPEEIAKVVLFLASDDASFCTGAYLPVDGGYLVQ